MGARFAAIGFGLTVAVALVLAVELSLRLLGIGERPTRRDPFAGFSTSVPMFEPIDDPGRGTLYRVSEARLRPRDGELLPEDGRQFRVDPDSDPFRVFVIGGSSAAGVPYPSRFAFGALLERRLQAALPDLEIEVVNAALSGYASRRLLLIAREIATYEPDLLVVYMGHNEWAERQYYAHLIDMDPRLFRAWEWLTDTRLYRVTSGALDRSLQPFEDPEPIDLDVARNSTQMFGVLRDRAAGRGYPSDRDLAYRDLLYEQNLREMVAIMRDAGARTLLVTLSQNLSDWSPGASDHRVGLGEVDLARWESFYAEGNRWKDSGDCERALASYDRALAIDDRFADLHFRVAGCHRAREEWDLARRHYRLASDLDRVPHGAPSHFNEIIRRVADDTDSLFFDAAALLEAESGTNLVGDDFFVDFLHPNLAAQQQIARGIAGELRRAGIPVASDRWRDGGYEDPDPDTLYAADPSLRPRELELRVFTCTLALRPECAGEAAVSLLAIEPDNELARQTLAHSGRGAEISP